MYANFYYQRSTKKYGRGMWHELGEAVGPVDDFPNTANDFLYIGAVYDHELFKDAELTP